MEQVDCSALKSMVDNHEGMISSIGRICFDIIELSRSFCEFKVVCVCREANFVAHRCVSMVLPMERALFLARLYPRVSDC